MGDFRNHKKFILLVEDEEIIVSLLRSRLEKANYSVKVARDGVGGLAMIRELEPDLVLLDMMLPRLSGLGILEKLYEEKIIPKLPVMVISNSGQPIEVEHILKLGVRDYLIKVNFDPNEVLAKVSRILAGEEEKNVPDSTLQKNSAQPSIHILVVEDDPFLGELLTKKFSQQGHAISVAIDRNQAMKILETGRVDIMLLDIVLPGMDGFSFLSELKKEERYQDMPVIIISNLGQADAIERGKKAGADDYIVKANTTPGEIVKKVEAVIKKYHLTHA
ncbi:MAG: response regulator [bacterium]|nr:response regulator [bacterium]